MHNQNILIGLLNDSAKKLKNDAEIFDNNIQLIFLECIGSHAAVAYANSVAKMLKEKQHSYIIIKCDPYNDSLAFCNFLPIFENYDINLGDDF